MEEEQLDELHDTLIRLCQHYEGMRQEVVKGNYNSAQAERDWISLTCNEGMSVLPILANMAFFQKVSKS